MLKGKSMRPEDLIEYHSTRAEKEMGLGLIAQGIPAARAHLQLASLHMQRARELGDQTVSHERPALIM